ncbi:hypothetical protein [Psychromonas aquimarina]|uniref:hypothetical protein n=1 Tax=Psychromonas aquimarina TaxID=444919 RepID=UPI0004263951|nr:hypothetical protein [Psychromonas aquimarina]
MNQSLNSGRRKPKSAGVFETKLSFALALITLLLISAYFTQSLLSIEEQGIITDVVERIEAQAVPDKKSRQREFIDYQE